MNRIIHFLVPIFLFPLTLHAADDGAENLVSNPGFESLRENDPRPVGWKVDRGTPEVRSGDGRSGEHFLRMEDPSAEETVLLASRPMPVRPGGTYTLSTWVRSQDEGAPGIYLTFFSSSGVKLSHDHARVKTPGDGWVQAQLIRDAPQGAATVMVSLYSFLADAGTFDFDDVSLSVEGGEPIAPPRVKPAIHEPVIVSSRRELFVDRHLIDGMDGVRFQLHHPHDEGKVLAFDRPWEGLFSGYVTILTLDDGFRAYYRGRPGGGKDGDESETTCVAESRDGITWTRPELGIHEINGSSANNAVLYRQAPYSHNFSPFIDTNPQADPAEKFKGIGGLHPDGPALFASPDGYHWTLKRESILTSKEFAFDSQACAFWSEAEKQYVCYFRTWKEGVRWVSRTTSDDCIEWSDPVEMKTEGPVEHFYTSQTHPYFRAPHLYLSLAARFVPNRQVITEEEARLIGVNPKYFKDTSDAILATSRAERPDYFERTFLSSFLRPGIGPENWVSRTNYPALNVVPTGPTEMSIYTNQNYAQPTAHLRRYSLRIDGFGSLHADYDGGEVLTRPLVFDGDSISLNFATSAAGGIRVELQTPGGEPIPGFSLFECREIIGNEIERDVGWDSASDLGDLAGTPVRLRIVMKDADLYALQFRRE